MTKKQKRAAAKRGWVTRRRNERKAFLRRSRASKKGWRRRKSKAKIVAEAKRKPSKKKGRLQAWIVIWHYSGRDKKNQRSVDFFVVARNKEDAELYVVKAVAAGEDSLGADLTWMSRIPWDERESYLLSEEQNTVPTQKELRKLGEGWVEVR